MLIGSGSVVLMYLISRNYSQDKFRVRLITLLGAVYPIIGFYVLSVTSETLYMFLCLLCAWQISRFLTRKPSLTYLIWSAIFGGLAVLTRPVFLAYVPFVLLVLLRDQAIPPRQKYINCATWLAVVCIVMAPWLIRNYAKLGVIKLDTASGQNFWLGNNPDSTGRSVFHGELAPPSYVSSLRNLQGLPEAPRDAAFTELAIRYIYENPIDFVRKGFYRVAVTWNTELRIFRWAVTNRRFKGIEPSADFVISGLLTLPHVFLMLAWIATMVFSPSSRNSLLFSGHFFAISAVSFVFLGDDRYHVPVLPFLIIQVCLFFPKIEFNRNKFGQAIQSPRFWLFSGLSTGYLAVLYHLGQHS